MANRQWTPNARRTSVGIPSRTRPSGAGTIRESGSWNKPKPRDHSWPQRNRLRPPGALSRSALKLIRKLLPFPIQVALELMDLELRKVNSPTDFPNVPADLIPNPADGWSVYNECTSPLPLLSGAERMTQSGLAPPNSQSNFVNNCTAGQSNVTPWGSTIQNSSLFLARLRHTSTLSGGALRFQYQVGYSRATTGPTGWTTVEEDPGGNNVEHESQPDNDTVPTWVRPVAPNIEPNNRPGAPAPTAPPEWARPIINDPNVIPPEWREVGPVPVRTRTIASPGGVVVPTPTGPIIWRPGWPFASPKPAGPPGSPNRPTTPAPNPPPAPKPETQPDPHLAPKWPVVSVRLGARRGPRTFKEQHWQRRPPSGRKEVKLGATGRAAWKITDALMNAVTEGTDLLEAIHDAICDGKKGKSKKPQDMIADLLDALQRDAIDWQQAARNIVYEQVMDAIIGKLAKTAGEAHRMAEAHIGVSSPIGIQSRLNAAQKPIGHGQPIGQVQAWIRQSDKYTGRNKQSRPMCKNSNRII